MREISSLTEWDPRTRDRKKLLDSGLASIHLLLGWLGRKDYFGAHIWERKGKKNQNPYSVLSPLQQNKAGKGRVSLDSPLQQRKLTFLETSPSVVRIPGMEMYFPVTYLKSENIHFDNHTEFVGKAVREHLL